jgi:hypothetical protein
LPTAILDILENNRFVEENTFFTGTLNPDEPKGRCIAIRPPTGREPVPEARCHYAQNFYHFVPGYATLHSRRRNEQPPSGAQEFDISRFIATLPITNEYPIQGE